MPDTEYENDWFATVDGTEVLLDEVEVVDELVVGEVVAETWVSEVEPIDAEVGVNPVGSEPEVADEP